MFFLATSHTKNTISEKTLKHTIQLIYPKKCYEHTLFLKVIIIAFTHMFFFVFQIFVCMRVCIIINFINIFRQMPVNTRRQTAGLSPLIKVSKKNERKQFQNGRCSIINQAGRI